jgi:serine/threonine-protein kinase
MSDNNDHIPDDRLVQVVNQDPIISQEAIETHLSSCTHCQTRLMEMAANQDWRDEFRDCIVTLQGSDQTLSSFTRLPKLGASPAAEPDAEFDLENINKMLTEILRPSVHPETLGKLGRFTVESVLGWGGMGVVLKGYDHELQRPVAIKLIRPRYAKNGTAKQRFVREARAAAAVLHPNVIAIHGIDDSNGVPWFAMPLIAGPSLRELVKECGPLPETEIIRIGMQIASGLAGAHSQGLVHRDIKPANILVDNQVNRVVITDFGLARRETDDAMTQTGVLAGTLNYMSPEQTQGATLDDRSDLFSLGSLLYYLATGDAPFTSDAPMKIIHQISNERQADVRSLNPDISSTLSAAIDRLLEKRPEDRFQSASELEEFLAAFVSHLNHPTGRQLPRLPRIETRFGLRKMAGIAALAACLILLGSIAVGWLLPKLAGPTLPSIPSAESVWTDIQAEYQLDTPSAFAGELLNLGQSVLTLESKVEQVESSDDFALRRQIEQMDRTLERFRTELGN